MLAAALALARFLHFGCLTVLFGAAVFPFYAARGPAWRTQARRIGSVSLAGALVSGVLWFAFAAAGMSGDLAAAVDPAAWRSVLADTPFGALWAARLVLALAIAPVLLRPLGRRRMIVFAALTGLLLASLALTGHSQGQEGWARVLHEAADAAHLLAAGAWIGGLVVLLPIVTGEMAAEGQARPPIGPVLSGFSGMGYLAVAALVVSGVVNSVFMLGSPSELISTGYGWVLTVKLGLFAAMCALAAANRFWISPALAAPARDPGPWLKRLRRHVLAEQVLAGLVLAAVAILGTLEPGVR